MGLELTEGKKALIYQAYCLLVEISLKHPRKEHIADKLFLSLDWNITSRAENVLGHKWITLVFVGHSAALIIEIEERPD